MVAKDELPKEADVDFMADAPPPRPYDEAITDAHRRVLKEAGLDIR